MHGREVLAEVLRRHYGYQRHSQADTEALQTEHCIRVDGPPRVAVCPDLALVSTKETIRYAVVQTIP